MDKISLSLPDGRCLSARIIDDENFPAINISWGSELVAFVEYNPEHDKGHEIQIGYYEPNNDDPVYYGPYVPDGKSNKSEVTADNQVTFFDDNTVIITENADGKMYLIKSKYIQDIIDDWMGDCNFVPANDAKVFFASWNNTPINPYEYTDFESLIRYFQKTIS